MHTSTQEKSSRSTQVTETDHHMANGQSVEAAVLDRYAKASTSKEASLCCPAASYDQSLVEMLPDEIIDKDYGCGDPSRFVSEGETVIDLGSGAGKACYMMSKKVGPEGLVVGVDFNDAMLSLARKYQGEMARRIGWANTRFVKARIQDMRLDLDALSAWLSSHPVASIQDVESFEAERRRIRSEAPGVANDVADVVVSNCVLNLVPADEKRWLFDEIFRVLRKGGRAVISDIVCDETPPQSMRNDPHLWSGCISGAFREDEFLEQFEAAGFHAIEIVERAEKPWQVVEGIEFRSMTVRAYKGKQGPCYERKQAVVFRGPWKKVIDDDGHVLVRGQRMAVCDKTFRLLTDPAGPYAAQIIGIEPREPVDPAVATPFACRRQARRSARETKGVEYRETAAPEACCTDGSCC